MWSWGYEMYDDDDAECVVCSEEDSLSAEGDRMENDGGGSMICCASGKVTIVRSPIVVN
jgi:hypothetical protein